MVHKKYLELEQIQKIMHENDNTEWNNIVYDIENKEYGACDFILNNKKVKFRIAKITPKKIGQFVALYKRNKEGITCPYNDSDDFDLLIIHVQSNANSGQFIFPKNILIQKGIIAENGVGGKRAFRVYPSWDLVNNNQALQSQQWQLNYFYKF